MRALGVACGVLAICAAAYEYTTLYYASKCGYGATLPRHPATAPVWAQWLSRREAHIRACTLLCIGGMASVALCGMFVCLLAKKTASVRRKPDSALVAMITNADHR